MSNKGNSYDNMSLAELKAVAKERGLKNISTMRKQALINALSEMDSPKDEKKAEAVREKREAEQKENIVEENRKVKNIKKEPIPERRPSTESRGPVSRASQDTGRPHMDRQNSRGGYENSSLGSSEAAKERKTYRVNRESPVPHMVAEDKREYREKQAHEAEAVKEVPTDMNQLDSGETKEGILEVMPDGYGFIRCDNYLPGENDVYVSPAQIRRFNLKTGDIIVGNTRIRSQNEKFSALLFVKSVNGFHPAEAQKRKKFEDLTPIFPNERIHLETPGCSIGMRMMDLVSPIGKGQRGMIVSQPKAGKTTLLKQVAKAVTTNYPDTNLLILLIDERPEEVTDIKESIEGENVEVIYSTFDELPENHKRVSEMVIDRARRLVEHKKDVVILLDSITRLARAYNLTVQPSGRTLSGGLDPAALHMPKKFFGAARNMREGGSLTILATALVETGSRMDDVVFEEFKGTGNMELVLDRSLSEKRIFPAIDLHKSGTRRDDLLLNKEEAEANLLMHRALNSAKSEEALEHIINMFLHTKNNAEFVQTVRKVKIV